MGGNPIRYGISHTAGNDLEPARAIGKVKRRKIGNRDSD